MTKWTEEQLSAIKTSGSNIIVSAGAGSGKTAVLSERVIEKLKNGIHINELLILTFTNNAAAEMKDRIKEKIEKDSSLKEELEYIDSASIMTFDAYALSIVKKYHYYLDVDNNINIIDSSIIKIKKKEIIDKLFNNLYEKKDKKFLNLVTKYGTKNDKTIKNLMIELNNKIDLVTSKEEYLNNYINYYYSKEFLNNAFKEYLELIDMKITSINSMLYDMSFYTTDGHMLKLKRALNKLLAYKDYEDIRNNLNIDFPRCPNGSEDEVKKYNENIKNIVKKELPDICKYSKKELINEVLSTKEDMSIIIEIEKELNKEIEMYKKEHNMYEFNDISRLLLKLLKENEEVKKEIKYSLKEIMIDEYQDTSDMQEEFISLIENNNVYMVGDIKQSIYRFRNANPNIFKNKYDLYKENNGGIKIDLNKNFRSRNEVLDSINNIFDHIMDNNIGNASYKEEHRLIFGNKDFTKNKTNNNYDLEILDYNKQKEVPDALIEAFIIARDIKEKINNQYQVLDMKKKCLRDCKYSDFSILMDRTTTFDIYKDVFNYMKIPLNVFKDQNILFDDETLLINNILGLIINISENKKDKETIIQNKFYYTSIARSYLYNECDSIIYDNVINNKIYDTDIYNKCYHLSLNINSISNEEMICNIIKEFNFYDKLNVVGDVLLRNRVIENIITKARELNEIGNGIKDVKNYLDELNNLNEGLKVSALNNEGNFVTITNIHKSKGLEYKICYFSGFGKSFNNEDVKDKIIYSNEYGIILPSYNETFKKTFINTLYLQKSKKEDISERIRLLYVALTRAKEKMYIVGSFDVENIYTIDKRGIIDSSERVKYKSFKDIIDSIYAYVGKYIKYLDDINVPKDLHIKKTIDFDNTSKDIIKVSELVKENEEIEEKHFSKVTNTISSEEEINNMKYGTHLHYILENFDFKNPNFNNLDDFEKQVITNLINHNIMKNIKDGKIFKEYEFIMKDETSLKRGVIDLMIEYNDYIDIIDYKLKNVNDPKYNQQLLGYKEFISNKTNKKVNIYLYSLLEKKLVEIK